MLRLLIVDDDELECDALNRFIDWKNLGIEVMGSCLNGIEALKKCKEAGADIVLSDIQMPIMSGLELNSCIRTILPQVKVVLMSAYDEFEYVQDAMNNGAFGYLLKPLQQEELIQMFNRCVSQCRQEIAHEEMLVQMKEEVNSVNAWKLDHYLHKLVLENEAEPPPDPRLNWLRNPDAHCALIYFRITSGGSPNEEIKRMVQELEAQGNANAIGLRTSIHRGIVLCRGGLSPSLLEQWQKRMGYCLVQANRQASWSELMREAEDQFTNRFSTPKLKPTSSNLLTDIEYAIDHNVFHGLEESLKAYFEKNALDAAVGSRLLAEKLMSRADDLMKERKVGHLVNLRRCIQQRGDLDQACGNAQLTDCVMEYIKSHAAVIQLLGVGDETGGFIQDCVEIIQRDFAGQTFVDAMAKQLHVSANYLSTIFKMKLGMSISEYAACYRIYSSMRMLATTEQSVADVALACGFANTHYYYTTFKKLAHRTPNVYRSRLKQNE